MKKISLLDFIKFGTFGPISLGMTKMQVIKLLGTPDYCSDNNIESDNFAYGCYEFYYWVDSGVIYGIQNDRLLTYPYAKTPKEKKSDHKKNISFKNKFYEVDTWVLTSGEDKTFQEIVKELNKEKLNFTETINNNDLKLHLESGVEIVFDNLSNYYLQVDNGNLINKTRTISKKEDFLLYGINIFRPNIK